MPDITALEQRIAVAFDRMDQGLERLARATQPSGPVDAVASAEVATGLSTPQLDTLLHTLEGAKASVAEWAERYRVLETQMQGETLAMANEIARLTSLLDAATPANPSAQPPAAADRDAEIDELTARIAQQEAELETLRALRAAEAADMGDLVAALAPLVEEVPHV